MSIYTATELEQGEKNPALLRTGTLSHVRMRKLATQGASGSTERLLTTIHASKLGQSWGEKGAWGIPTFMRSGYLLMCWQVVYIQEVGARMCGGNIWIFVKKTSTVWMRRWELPRDCFTAGARGNVTALQGCPVIIRPFLQQFPGVP